MDKNVSKRAWDHLLISVLAGDDTFYSLKSGVQGSRTRRSGPDMTTVGHGFDPESVCRLTDRGRSFICAHLPARFGTMR